MYHTSQRRRVFTESQRVSRLLLVSGTLDRPFLKGHGETGGKEGMFPLVSNRHVILWTESAWLEEGTHSGVVGWRTGI